MKIGLDISQVVYEGTGVSRFTKGLIDTICTYDTKNKWVFFFSGFRRKLDHKLKEKILCRNYELIERSFPPKLISFLWNKRPFFSQLATDYLLLTTNFDWFITSDWTEIPSKKTKKATIVHDLTYIRYPELVEKNVRNIQTERLQRVKKESSLIFADSYATKEDIMHFLGIEEKRIVVNYPGVTVTEPPKNEIKDTLEKFKIDKPFILSVGKIEPRKNFDRLIEAFQELKREDIELIIAGPKGWESLDTSHKQLNNIKIFGLVSDKDLYSLYAASLFFVLPSLWEGFGYPVIEAMQLGVPVACSDTSSLKELGNKNAVLFDPVKTNEIKNALNRLLNELALCESLSKKGKAFAESFTWKRYYNTMIDALENHIKI